MTAETPPTRLLPLALLGIFPFLVNGLVNSVIAQHPLLYWSFELLTWVVIPCGVLYFVSRTPGFSFADLGYHTSLRDRRNVGLVGLACLLFAPLVYAVYAFGYEFFSAILPEDSFFSYDSIVPEAGFFYYLVVIYFALSAGLVEEFLFRGLLYRAFAGFRHSLVLFLLVSPLLFSLVHWEDGLANLVTTYVVGVFMAFAYLGFRNLWPLVVGHVFTDLLWFG
jgi:membrane protease YdiL (CAAX protease family)